MNYEIHCTFYVALFCITYGAIGQDGVSSDPALDLNDMENLFLSPSYLDHRLVARSAFFNGQLDTFTYQYDADTSSNHVVLLKQRFIDGGYVNISVDSITYGPDDEVDRFYFWDDNNALFALNEVRVTYSMQENMDSLVVQKYDAASNTYTYHRGEVKLRNVSGQDSLVNKYTWDADSETFRIRSITKLSPNGNLILQYTSYAYLSGDTAVYSSSYDYDELDRLQKYVYKRKKIGESTFITYEKIEYDFTTDTTSIGYFYELDSETGELKIVHKNELLYNDQGQRLALERFVLNDLGESPIKKIRKYLFYNGRYC